MIKINDSKIQILDTHSDFSKFCLPQRILISGPSHSGKSHFLHQLIKFREQIFDKKFHRIIYCFPENLSEIANPFIDKLKEEYPSLEINLGVPKVTTLGLNSDLRHSLLLIDDLFQQCANSADISEIFTVLSHHLFISIVITSQNLFAKAKYGLNISRNATTKVIFEDKGDNLCLNILSRRIFSNSNILQNAFDWLKENTNERYLVIDCSPLSHLPKKLQLRSRIFPMDDSKIRPIFF